MPKRPPKIRAELPVPNDLRKSCAGAPVLAWQSEVGKLWLGDCLDFLAALPDQSVRLAVCDPPYAIGKAHWDEFASAEDYLSWCDRWLAEISRVLASDGTAYVWGFSETLADIKTTCQKHFAGGCRWLVWSYKNKANLGSDWGRSHESALHFRKARKFVMNIDDVRVPYNAHTKRYPVRVQAVSSQYGKGKRRDKWEPHPLGAKPRDVFDVPVLCNGTDEKTDHPTQKPEEIIRRLVAASSNPGDLVIDPFVGSGTTLVVAHRLGRHFAGADSDAGAVGLSRDRMRRAAQEPSVTVSV